MSRTSNFCGTFPEGAFTDYGQCRPRRVKRNCTEDWGQGDNTVVEPPDVECVDENAVIEARPDLVPPFRVVSAIFDEDCEEILDENDQPINGSTF